MAVTTEMVKELRAVTGAGVLEAKKALEQHNGDFDKAIDMLREKGAARAAKRADRSAKEGVIELYAHPGNRVGVMLELNCETDFVARNEGFVTLANDLAMQVAANPQVRAVKREELDQAFLDSEREILIKQAESSGKPREIIEKMVEGRMSKIYEEVCLLDQPFIKDDKKKVVDIVNETIQTTGENITVRRFARFQLGESA